jgi:hypothetical protein
LVTAIHFFDAETAIFNGRSPNGILLPTGERLHPLGRRTFDSTLPGVLVTCEKDIKTFTRKTTTKIVLMC